MKRAANSGEPGPSLAGSGQQESSLDGTHYGQQQSSHSFREPVAKKINLDVRKEINESVVEQSGALIPGELLAPNVKREVEEDDEDEEEEASRSPIAAMDEEEEEEDDAESVIDKTDIPQPPRQFLTLCEFANLPKDAAIGTWELFYHASQRVALEGSEKAWQLAAAYYYFLSRGVKRRGKPCRQLLQPLPLSFHRVVAAFDISVMEVFDKTARFIEIMHSRKMRRYMDYLRRLQETLACSCVIFKKFIKVYCTMFIDCKLAIRGCPHPHDLFSLLWTSFLVLKSRLPTDDLISNYHLLFSMLDDFYTTMCSMKDGVVHHLNQEFVSMLLNNDCTILRALCNQFGGSVLDARHFYDHTYKKIDKTGITTTWAFIKGREPLIYSPKAVYEKYLMDRGCIDERIFVPTKFNFPEIFKPNFESQATKMLRFNASGVEFRDAEILNQISQKQCLEKLTHSQPKTAADRLAHARELLKVPCVDDFRLGLGKKFPEDQDSSETHERMKKMISGWQLHSSKLKSICEQMSDNPMATLLLKCDVMCEKFEDKLATELGEEREEGVPYNRYHKQLRMELEKLFLVFIEKILIVETKKKVREEDLLNVIRREDFLDSVFCFCVELTLFSNNYQRAFPWSAELCDTHPFQFHKVIDLMINNEKRLSRHMVQHFNSIEESVIECHAWRCDSPLWRMLTACPFSYFQEFGDEWSDKLNSYSPVKFTPTKKGEAIRDELGRPIVPHNQASRTLKVFLKRTLFTAARRLQDLTARISMPVRPKSQCWSLFDYLIRNETLILMDRHLDQILLCCVYVVMKVNNSEISFNEIMAHYRRQAKDATYVYRNVNIFADQLTTENPVNTKETIFQRLEASPREKVTVNLIQYYNLEFRDRIKYIIGQLDGAADEDLMEMPVPTAYGLLPVKVYLTDKLSIQMLPKTDDGTSPQEVAIANLEKNGVILQHNSGSVSVPFQN